MERVFKIFSTKDRENQINQMLQDGWEIERLDQCIGQDWNSLTISILFTRNTDWDDRSWD